MKRRHMMAAGAALAANQLVAQPRRQVSPAAKTQVASLSGDAYAYTDSYVVPAEESLHQRTFMQWPVNKRVHTDPVFLEMVQQTIANIANAIAEFEPVVMLGAAQYHGLIRRRVSSKVALWDIPTDDLWCRDAGPLFGVSATGQLSVRHIQFNGWGGKQVHQQDADIAQRVANRLGLPIVAFDLRGEAGGVEQDGHGMLLAHESSWVNRNRNPGQSRLDIERLLLAAYGAQQMVWAPGVKGKDITDYHIDSLARFTGPGQVLMNMPKKPDALDPFHQAAQATYAALVSAGLRVELIPEPGVRRVQSHDFVASYANYYVCNGAVMAAQFGDKETDDYAHAALKRLYPRREVVMLNVDTLGELGGGIHCAIQQMPA